MLNLSVMTGYDVWSRLCLVHKNPEHEDPPCPGFAWPVRDALHRKAASQPTAGSPARAIAISSAGYAKFWSLPAW